MRLFLILMSFIMIPGSLTLPRISGDCTSPSLKIDVLRIERAIADDDLDMDNVTLRLRFKNSGKSQIILYKRSIGVEHVWISRNDEKLRAKLYEASTAYTLLYDSLPDNLGLEDFAILDPEGEFEKEVQIPILVRKVAELDIPGSVQKGNHSVSIRVKTWHWNEEATALIAKKFSSYGCLVSESLNSKPIHVKVK